MNEEKFNEILSNVKSGMNVTDAIRSAGISINRFYDNATNQQKAILKANKVIITINHKSENSPKEKVCRKCKEKKKAEEFYTRAVRCKDCMREPSKIISTDAFEKKIAKLRESYNYKVIKGYKFNGTIPPPKDDSYYLRY